MFSNSQQIEKLYGALEDSFDILWKKGFRKELYEILEPLDEKNAEQKEVREAIARLNARKPAQNDIKAVNADMENYRQKIAKIVAGRLSSAAMGQGAKDTKSEVVDAKDVKSDVKVAAEPELTPEKVIAAFIKLRALFLCVNLNEQLQCSEGLPLDLDQVDFPIHIVKADIRLQNGGSDQVPIPMSSAAYVINRDKVFYVSKTPERWLKICEELKITPDEFKAQLKKLNKDLTNKSQLLPKTELITFAAAINHLPAKLEMAPTHIANANIQPTANNLQYLIASKTAAYVRHQDKIFYVHYIDFPEVRVCEELKATPTEFNAQLQQFGKAFTNQAQALKHTEVARLAAAFGQPEKVYRDDTPNHGVAIVTIPPHPDNWLSLPARAYVRNDDQIFYIDKAASIIRKINVTPDQFNEHLEVVGKVLTTQAQLLSKAELARFTALLGHKPQEAPLAEDIAGPLKYRVETHVSPDGTPAKYDTSLAKQIETEKVKAKQGVAAMLAAEAKRAEDELVREIADYAATATAWTEQNQILRQGQQDLKQAAETLDEKRMQARETVIDLFASKGVELEVDAEGATEDDPELLALTGEVFSDDSAIAPSAIVDMLALRMGSDYPKLRP